jgi:hypothetical protein
MAGMGVSTARRPPLLVVLSAMALVSGLALPGPAAAEANVEWLCKPGLLNNPCKPGLKTTILSPSDEELGIRAGKRARPRKIDCFYVYPTVSDQPGPQANREADPEVRSVALYQAARFSRVCRVFAPVYRQITIEGVLNPEQVSGEVRRRAYSDIRRAWRSYLENHNRNRGVTLIGHSQGTHWLTKLAAEEIEPRRRSRRRLVSALLIGPASGPLGSGAITVKKGRDTGGNFKRLKACRSPRQIRCVVSYSAFNRPLPEDTVFARTDKPGREVMCTNPAALRGGSASLKPVYPSEPFAPGTIAALSSAMRERPQPAVKTPWLSYHGAYRARCEPTDGANPLQVSGSPGAPGLNPMPFESWGLHLDDINLATGNLTSLVRKQGQEFVRKRR